MPTAVSQREPLSQASAIAESHVAAARTLGAALGIPDGVLNDDFVADAGGKVVRAALASG